MTGSIDSRFNAAYLRMDAIEKDLRENTELTRDIRDVIVATKVGFKVLAGMGTAAKWITYIVTPLVALWGYLHSGPK